MNDLNAPLEPPADPEPVAPPAPEPQIDLDAAYRAVADAEGWDPRVTRYEMQEFKRRKEDLERREREFDQRTLPPPRQEPIPDFGGDQYAKLAYEARQEAAETKRMLQGYLDEQKRERDKEALIQSLGSELDTAFNAAARQAGMTRDQLQNQTTRQDFFALLTEIYPEPEMIARIGSDQAVRNALRIFRSNGTGYASPAPTYRNPRASLYIQGAPTGTPQSESAQDDSGPQRPGETIEQALERTQRRLQALQQAGFGRGLPDGMRVSSG